MSTPRSTVVSRIVIVVAVVAVAAGLYADAELALDAGVVQLTADDQPTAGVTTCAALAADDTAGRVVVTSLLGEVRRDEGWAATVVRADGADRTALASPAAPGTTGRVGVDLGSEEIVTARWEDAPLLLGRRLTVGEEARVAGGVQGPCPGSAAARWVVPGVVTAGGASATLHLANPTTGPAAVEVTFTTPDGRIEPTRLGNVVVPPGERRIVDLNQFVPEQTDIGVDVTARSGRVVVEAIQQFEAAIGGVDGRSLATATTDAAEQWTIPFVDGSDRATSWIWVTNPGDRTTEVRLVVHGPDGPLVPPGAGTTLAAGTTQRIDLRGVLDGGVGGVTLRSTEGAPIVAHGAVLRTGPPPTEAASGAGDDGQAGAVDTGGEDQEAPATDDADALRGGIAVVAGSRPLEGRGAVTVDVLGGRSHTLWLANPGDVDARVDVRLVGADGDAGTVGEAIVVPAGGVTTAPLDLPAGGVVAVVLDVTDGAIAATVVTATDRGPLELASLGVSSLSGDSVLVLDRIRRDRSLLHPIDLPTPQPTPSADAVDG